MWSMDWQEKNRIENPHGAKLCSDVPSNKKREKTTKQDKGETIMSSNKKTVVPSARDAMNQFKMEAASDLRVPVPS